MWREAFVFVVRDGVSAERKAVRSCGTDYKMRPSSLCVLLCLVFFVFVFVWFLLFCNCVDGAIETLAYFSVSSDFALITCPAF